MFYELTLPIHYIDQCSSNPCGKILVQADSTGHLSKWIVNPLSGIFKRVYGLLQISHIKIENNGISGTIQLQIRTVSQLSQIQIKNNIMALSQRIWNSFAIYTGFLLPIISIWAISLEIYEIVLLSTSSLYLRIRYQVNFQTYGRYDHQHLIIMIETSVE